MKVLASPYRLLASPVQVVYLQAFPFSFFKSCSIFLLVICFKARNQYFFSSLFKVPFLKQRFKAQVNPIFLKPYWRYILVGVIILRFILKNLLFRLIPSMLHMINLKELCLDITLQKVMLLAVHFFRWFN